jgi:hypothetical protein
MRHRMAAAIAVAFVLSRAWLAFFWQPPHPATDLFRRLAVAHQEGATLGVPPLQLIPILMPAHLVPLDENAGIMTRVRWNGTYARLFRVELFFDDTLIFFFVLAALVAWRPGPLLVYTVAGAALFPILYDRLDLLAGALALLALTLLVGKRHIVWAHLVLAFTVAYEPAMVALVPLFLARDRDRWSRVVGAALVAVALALDFYYAGARPLLPLVGGVAVTALAGRRTFEGVVAVAAVALAVALDWPLAVGHLLWLVPLVPLVDRSRPAAR